ncbi:MAG TPA: hypothetical protein VIY69_04575 [Candidatus Acidoferrales bacterium]
MAMVWEPMGDSGVRSPQRARTLGRTLVDLWLTATIVAFLIVRVIDSHIGQRLLHKIFD